MGNLGFGRLIGRKTLPEGANNNSGLWQLASQYYLRSINRWISGDYSVSPNTSNINESQSVTFTTTTVGVPDNTTLYYTISGTVTAADFSSGSLSGSFVVNSNSGAVTLTAAAEYSTEGSETFVFQVRTGSTSGPIVATSSTVTINDTTLTPTYSVNPSTTSVNEGSSVTFNISTTNLPDGTTLYYTLNTVSGTVDASDFSSGSLSGSVTVNSSAASVAYTLSSDLSVGEGDEQFQLQLRTGSISGTVVATSPTVTISDSSRITYAVSPSVSSITEGSSVTFNVTTLNVSNGTTLYYSINQVSGTITASDFTTNSLTGSFTINSNSGSVTLTASTTATNEGSESFQFQVRTVSTSGTVVATSTTVTITEPAVSITTSGAITSDTGGYRYHVYTGPGSFTINSTSQISVDYLVVAGGGGGNAYGGGGGAGGFRNGTGLVLTGPSPFPISVGAGGAYNATISGSASVFSSITSTGGGGGGSPSGNPGGSGGGGGASYGATNAGPFPGGSGNSNNYTPPEGNPGGAGIYYANSSTTVYGGWHGGGGGAGTAGGNGSYSTGGNGGQGASSPLGSAMGYGSPSGWFAAGGGGIGAGVDTTLPSSTPIYNIGSGGSGGFGGGGQGGSSVYYYAQAPNGIFYYNPIYRVGGNGATNTGSGGGGGWPDPGAGISYAQGNGGSGIVIIRYLWPL